VKRTIAALGIVGRRTLKPCLPREEARCRVAWNYLLDIIAEKALSGYRETVRNSRGLLELAESRYNRR
jgi:hypothetical protein